MRPASTARNLSMSPAAVVAAGEAAASTTRNPAYSVLRLVLLGPSRLASASRISSLSS